MYKEYEVLTLGAELKKLLEKKSEPLMQKYGLRKIRLHEDREDHRFNHIFLMEKSDAVIKDFLKVHEECWHVLLHGISEEERIFLDQICGRMQQNITEELRKL